MPLFPSLSFGFLAAFIHFTTTAAARLRQLASMCCALGVIRQLLLRLGHRLLYGHRLFYLLLRFVVYNFFSRFSFFSLLVQLSSA